MPKLCYNKEMENKDFEKMIEYFREVKVTKEYNPYKCSVEEAISIVIVGTFCKFENLKEIHYWASQENVARMLKDEFGVNHIPCYYWLTCLIKMIEPTSLNECFTNWVSSLLPEGNTEKTISFDGKTVRSTNNMSSFEQPLHIISAQIAEFGLTFGQEPVASKSNEIPAVQTLIKLLKLDGCMVVADALNCQKKTAEAVIDKKADYLLSVKDNQKSLKTDIENHIQNAEVRENLEIVVETNNRSDRIETRTAIACSEISFLHKHKDWKNLCFVGAIHREVTTKSSNSSEWHYYISSRVLSAKELLKFARNEWCVESMHWLLDVHFNEDKCRLFDKNAQINMNIIRKLVLNLIRNYKNNTGSKIPFSNLMVKCVANPLFIKEMVKTRN